MIYQGGDQTAAWAIVQNPEEEKALAADGFFAVGHVEEAQPVKRGRKPKGEV